MVVRHDIAPLTRGNKVVELTAEELARLSAPAPKPAKKQTNEIKSTA
jgi:hypothetical protein